MIDIYGELDPGIAEVVRVLRDNHFNTFSSCEGGEGHAFQSPTVVIAPRNTVDHLLLEERTWIAKALTEAGYSGFYISIVWAYQSETVAWDQQGPCIEVEFWALVDGEVPRKATT